MKIRAIPNFNNCKISTKAVVVFLFTLNLSSCHSYKIAENNSVTNDNRSFAEPQKAKITHLNWQVEVDFNTKTIKGSATYDFIQNGLADFINFDTDHLLIDSVLIGHKKVAFELGKMDSILGQKLSIPINKSDKKVSVFYHTSPEAVALQWLDPQQTHDKKYPFLLTQGESILTRSYIPIQDSPGIKITYEATVEVPKELMAVMSATNPKEKNETGIYHFEMKQNISPYLIALAVGDIKYHAYNNHSGVYAETGMLKAAAWELEDMPKMIETAEKLYGKYPFEQYDVLILPPSFPFGGMENPRLTFATPTIIAGDKSLVSLIAHELAHSWSGNLVTNATWDDFWLNEGFTVYFERRIMEEIYGKDYSDMLAVIGYEDLEVSMRDYPKEFTSLKVDLSKNHPDDAFSDVPYDKGYSFLIYLENRFGREAFDPFLKKYFSQYAFQSVTTEEFLSFLDKNLTHGQNDFVKEWVYDSGWPHDLVKPHAVKFDEVDEQFNEKMEMATSLTVEDLKRIRIIKPNFDTNQWIHFIRNINSKNTTHQMEILDKLFRFTNSHNAEIQAAWYEKAIDLGYNKINPDVNQNLRLFLVEVGRRKYLEPLYLAMVRANQIDLAQSIYREARPNYHSVSRGTIDKILNFNKN